MDGPIDSAAAQERPVRCIYDRIDAQACDVADGYDDAATEKRFIILCHGNF